MFVVAAPSTPTETSEKLCELLRQTTAVAYEWGGIRIGRDTNGEGYE